MKKPDNCRVYSELTGKRLSLSWSSPLPASQEPKGQENPFSRTTPTVDFSLFCELSHVNSQPVPLEACPAPQHQCALLILFLLVLCLGSQQQRYLQKTRLEPVCCCCISLWYLPNRNSVSQLQLSHFYNFKTSVHDTGKPELFYVSCLDIMFYNSAASFQLLW